MKAGHGSTELLHGLDTMSPSSYVPFFNQKAAVTFKANVLMLIPQKN